MADPWIWGMLAWPIQMDVVRSALLKRYSSCQPQTGHMQMRLPTAMQATGAIVGIPLEPDPSERDLLFSFFHALAKVYPCSTCRDSYGQFLHVDPPDRATNLFVWLWELKNKVNHKLGRDGSSQCLPLEKFEKRLRVLSSFSAVDQVWDLLCIFALNYPNMREDSMSDEERADVLQRRRGYFQILAALSVFLGRLCTHHTIATYIDPMKLTATDLSSRDTFVAWIVQQRQQWAAATGGLAYTLEESQERYAPSAPILTTPDTRYTCPNPALLPSGTAPAPK